MTMHSYWVGIATELERAGDQSLRWMLEAAVAGEVFAAGHAEAGNDIPVLLSTCPAERVEGGYRLTGRKQFGSNGPAWRWLGAHAIDADAPGGPQIVHAFVERTSPGVTVVETWDTLGMRPTQSHDTILDGVFVPDDRIGRVVPAGDGSDLFLVAMAMWPLSLIAAVYLGIADRALELAVDAARRKTSMAIDRGAYAYNPMVQHQVAEMYLELDAASATVDRFVDDWGTAPTTATLGAQGLLHEVAPSRRPSGSSTSPSTWSGGGGMFKGNELERLYRDVRCGGFHPGNDAKEGKEEKGRIKEKKGYRSKRCGVYVGVGRLMEINNRGEHHECRGRRWDGCRIRQRDHQAGRRQRRDLHDRRGPRPSTARHRLRPDELGIGRDAPPRRHPGDRWHRRRPGPCPARRTYEAAGFTPWPHVTYVKLLD